MKILINFFVTLIIVFFSFDAESQENKRANFLNSFTAGTSLTYIINLDDSFYEEYTWNLNFAASISQRMNVGIQVLNIYANGSNIEKASYNIFGLFTQYDFFAKKRTKNTLFVELSINKGDYCTCDNLDPYRKSNLWYYGFGGGTEIRLKKISEHIFLDISFYNYQIINKYKKKYNFTQYIIGLNYRFGKLK